MVSLCDGDKAPLGYLFADCVCMYLRLSEKRERKSVRFNVPRISLDLHVYIFRWDDVR